MSKKSKSKTVDFGDGVHMTLGPPSMYDYGEDGPKITINHLDSSSDEETESPAKSETPTNTTTTVQVQLLTPRSREILAEVHKSGGSGSNSSDSTVDSKKESTSSTEPILKSAAEPLEQNTVIEHGCNTKDMHKQQQTSGVSQLTKKLLVDSPGYVEKHFGSTDSEIEVISSEEISNLPAVGAVVDETGQTLDEPVVAPITATTPQTSLGIKESSPQHQEISVKSVSRSSNSGSKGIKKSSPQHQEISVKSVRRSSNSGNKWTKKSSPQHRKTPVKSVLAKKESTDPEISVKSRSSNSGIEISNEQLQNILTEQAALIQRLENKLERYRSTYQMLSKQIEDLRRALNSTVDGDDPEEDGVRKKKHSC